jgi:GT2 family glycosyltransferase
MNIDTLLQSLKKHGKIDSLFQLTDQTKSRLKKYEITENAIDINNISLTRGSKTLIVDFNPSSFFIIKDNLLKISKFYKKIIIIGFRINYYEASQYVEALSCLPKNYILEATDVDSYNISQACGSHTTLLSPNPISYQIKPSNINVDGKIDGKISVICACMNRMEILKVNIMSWLNFSEIGEIVIVDWNSKQPLYDLLKLDKRIKIVRVEDQKYFNISQAFNLALDNSTLEYVLKLDTDYFLNPYYNFFKSHPVQNDSFYVGCWHHCQENNDIPKPIFQHLSGLCYARREYLIAVKGYNEHFTGYGYDDTDLHNRILASGKRKIIINHDYSVMHIPHSTTERLANYEPNSWNDKRNKELSLSMGLAPDRVKSWSIIKSYTPNLYFAYETSNDIQ